MLRPIEYIPVTADNPMAPEMEKIFSLKWR
jgi:hypothetical protein